MSHQSNNTSLAAKVLEETGVDVRRYYQCNGYPIGVNMWDVRPCDAQGLDILHGIFVDKPKDSIFGARFEKITILGLSCSQSDGFCFCAERTPGSTIGSDLLFIAGGIALPLMRSLIWTCLDSRQAYRNITIFYGQRLWPI